MNPIAAPGVRPGPLPTRMQPTPSTAPPADPMPAAALGMWLFLAGEAMFFAGLLSAFLVLQSSPGERALFVRSARVVNLPLTLTAAALIAVTAVVLWRGATRASWLAVAGGVAVAFLIVQVVAAGLLLRHETVVTATDVYDGAATHKGGYVTGWGYRSPLPPALDVARTLPADVARGTAAGPFTVAESDARLVAAYGPSRNNYFGCYFLVTVAHALHVGAGLIALAWLTWRTRRRTASPGQTRAVVLYWQFVNGVGLLALLILALG